LSTVFAQRIEKGRKKKTRLVVKTAQKERAIFLHTIPNRGRKQEIYKFALIFAIGCDILNYL